MATVKYLFVSILLFFFCNESTGNYTISFDNILTKVPYKGSKVSVWREGNIFYMMPLGFMQKNSVKYSEDKITAAKKLVFEITLVNKDLKETAVNHLRVFTGECIQTEQLQLVPLKSIKVVLKSRPDSFFTLNKQWIISMMTDPDVLQMSIPCVENLNICQLVKNMLEGDRAIELNFNVTSNLFKLPVKVAANLTSTDVKAKAMVKCKPTEQVNMENLIKAMNSIAQTVQGLAKNNARILEIIENSFVKKCKFGDSKIVSDAEMRRRLIKMVSGVTRYCWKKCYTGSENDFSASNFHYLCDNRGATVTLLQVGDQISGGFTDHSWSDNGRGVRASGNKAFLFSLTKNEKMMIKYGKSQMTNYGGPTFGSGGEYDLKISDKCHNESSTSHTLHLGKSYALPSGHRYLSENTQKFLTGVSGTFKCTEYEVYYQEK